MIYIYVSNSIIRVNIYKIKKIIFTIKILANNFKKLIKIIKSLF